MYADLSAKRLGEVRGAKAAEIDRLSHLLARAFRDEPFHQWVFPSETQRARSSARFFAIGLRESIERETVLTTHQLEGVSVWRAPDQHGQSLLRLPVVAYQAARLLRSSTPRVFRGLLELGRRHPRASVWYLTCLGTEPERQGRGVASALLRPVLDECDATCVYAHLVTSDPINLGFYRRHSFEVTTEFDIPGGPPAWEMVRPPRPAA